MLEGFRRTLRRRDPNRPDQVYAPARSGNTVVPAPEIAPDDPIVELFVRDPSPIEVERLDADSPAVRSLKAAGVKLVVPLVSQGELVGTINLGARLSEEDYSAEDRVLLSNLAAQAAPAVRVAQLVKFQEAAAVARERLDQELRVARDIQLSLLPKRLPRLPGWKIAAYYRPARAVGGDFYDFIDLQDGRLGITVGDVADKGVPAAIVMASTRAILRAAARQAATPAQALARANDLLYPDMPRNMFVTCLYAILDPRTGRLEYSNAGHNVPYRRSGAEVSEVRATGMPLGLLPELAYDDRETILAPGETLLLYSDGLTEARNRRRQMFGIPRMTALMHEGECGTARGEAMIDCLLAELARFTGADWEQEDDVTIVTIDRAPDTAGGPVPDAEGEPARPGRWRPIAEFSLASEAGNERAAVERVTSEARAFLPDEPLRRLRTAVTEAVLNAIEHGNRGNPELPVTVQLLQSDRDLLVRVRDEGPGASMPEYVEPNLEAKLAGREPPRGWGLFLIRNMVDEIRETTDDGRHVLEMIVHRGGGRDGR